MTKNKNQASIQFGKTGYLLQNPKMTFEGDFTSNDFNISRSTKNVQLIEREWLERLQTEKERNRTRERESKKQITKLNNDLKQEVTNLNREITKSCDIKRSNTDMRNKMAEYVVKNSQLKKLNDQNQYKIGSLQSRVDQVNSQVGMLELQNQQLNQKLTKRQFKYLE